jgi:hypothetical protein
MKYYLLKARDNQSGPHEGGLKERRWPTLENTLATRTAQILAWDISTQLWS